MNLIKACVIDDEPLAGQLIGSYILRTPFMQNCGLFSSAQEAIKVLLEERIDIVFLDIKMPQLTGLELASIIPPSTQIVFTTAYSEYAIDGFKARAIDYLLKPVSYDDFMRATKKALEIVQLRRKANCQDVLIVKSDYKLFQIPYSKILYIEGLKDYVKIYIEGEQRPLMTLVSMKHFEGMLQQSRFLRIHRSYIVNLSKIDRIERMHIVIGHASLPISESYRSQVAEYVNAHSLVPARTYLGEF